MEAWGLEADGIRGDLLDMLRQVRLEERASAPSIDGVMSRAEVKIGEILRRLGPSGTRVTPAVIAAAHRAIAGVFKEELMLAGMGESTATALAGVLVAVTKIKERQ